MIMKKIYFLAVLALVAGVSCTKQVPVTTQNNDVAISFSPVSNRVGTKANVFGEQNATYTAGAPSDYESFAAWAYYTGAASTTTNPQTNSTAADGMEFFGTSSAGVTCNHHAAVGGAGTDYWEPATTYYWPRAGYLHVHAMSPAAFGTGTLTHTWANGVSITGYVAPVYTDATAEGLTADASQIDLMYSDFIFDKQRANYTQTGNTVGTYDDEDDSGIYTHDGVNVLFRHALSLVQFKVKTAADYTSGTQKHKFFVRKIEVLNAYNTGNFAENRKNDLSNGYNAVADMSDKIGFTSDNANNAQTPYWTNFSNEVTLTPYDVTAGASKTGTEATSVLSSQVGTTLIALPQPLVHTNNVQVRVTFDYQFSANNGTNWTDALNQTITIDLGGAKGTYDSTGTPTANYVVNNWLINHKYIYTLQFKLDPIIFDPAVEAFVTVDDIGVDLPF